MFHDSNILVIYRSRKVSCGRLCGRASISIKQAYIEVRRILPTHVSIKCISYQTGFFNLIVISLNNISSFSEFLDLYMTKSS